MTESVPAIDNSSRHQTLHLHHAILTPVILHSHTAHFAQQCSLKWTRSTFSSSLTTVSRDAIECYSTELRSDVEWISTLPPGFVYELPQHLLRPAPNSPPVDPLTGLPFCDFDNYCCGAHGLSILIVCRRLSSCEPGTPFRLTVRPTRSRERGTRCSWMAGPNTSRSRGTQTP